MSRRDRVALAGLAALALFPFGQLLLHPTWLVAPGSDVANQLAVHHEALRRAVALGEWPWWNPWRGAGAPLLANPQSALFHPMSLLALAVPPERVYGPLFALHQIWGALGTFLWLRMRKSSLPAALLGGAMLALAGKLLAHAHDGNLNMLAQAAWIPWAFAAMERALTGGGRRAVAATAAIVTVAFLGGHLQEWFYMALALAVLAAAHLPPARAERDSGLAGVARRALVAAAPMALAAATLAIQLGPSAELAGHTTRAGGLDAAHAAQQALTPDHLLTLYSPRLFGGIGEPGYWGPYHPWERYLYLGLLPLALLPIGAARVLRSGDRTARAMLAFAVFAGLFSFGGALFRWCFEWIPGMSLFRIPTRMLFPALPALALLAAAGLESCLERATPARVAAALLGGLAAVGAAASTWIAVVPGDAARHLARWVMARISADLTDPMPSGRIAAALPGWLDALRAELAVQAVLAALTAGALIGLARAPARRHVALVALGALLVIDLARVGAPLVELAPPERLMPVTLIVRELERRAIVEEPFRLLDLDRLVNPAVALAHGIEKLDVYDPVILDRLRRLTNLQVPEGPDRRPTWLPIEELEVRPDTDLGPLGLLNVRYLASRRPLVHPQLEEVELDGDPAEHLYRFVAAGPRARWVPRARSFPRGPEGERALLVELGASDPTREVLLLGAETPAPRTAGGPAWTGADASLRWVTRGADRVELELTAPADGWLVLAANDYPGWSADVNGTPTRIEAADLAFQALPVPAGTSRVRLRFRPTRLATWAAISGAGIAATLALALVPSRRRERYSSKSDE